MTMALEEVAARTAAAGGPRTVRVYTWPDVLSLGYREDPDTVDWEFCEQEGVSVTRRQTGGGGIYHDAHAEVSYGVVAPAAELPGDLIDAYRLLSEPLFDFFDRLGVPADFAAAEREAVHQPACYLRAIHPAHDVLADGRKLSGNAQYRQRDAVIQHGSILLDTDDRSVRRQLGVFGNPVTEDRFRDRVTAVSEFADVTREKALKELEAALGAWADADPGDWTDDELARARALADNKYATAAWTRHRENHTG
jgi:lipoate-protein ligase A